MTTPTAARFQVDPRLATLLGESYRSSEQAIKELVDNAWDAEAQRVEVQLPAAMTTDPIVIADNGNGMTEAEVRNEYLLVASDRRSRKGERTPNLNRLVKGRKGIGKFAGLMVADVMALETTTHGHTTSLVIRKEELLRPHQDLEHIDLPIHTALTTRQNHGTIITLTYLSQRLAFPLPEKLRELLVREYGRQDGFEVRVNGELVSSEDLPGLKREERADVPGLGPVTLRYTVVDAKRPLKHSGLVLRVDGKTVGMPVLFGLDQDEAIPGKLCRKIYGEVIADGLSGDVTADGGAIVENSLAFEALRAWARPLVADGITEVFKNEVSLAKARHQQELNRRLAELPAYRRHAARQAVERVLAKFYGESEERISAVLNVMFDAFEHDEYWAVVQALDEARQGDVAMFADALDEFGLVDMGVMGQQAQSRLRTLDALDQLIARPETLEAVMHRSLEHNLWVLGSEFAMVRSNQTLESALGTYIEEEAKRTRSKRRPDLLLCSELRGRYLLIEFKRPAKDITRDDENQAIKYRDDLRRRYSPMEILMIGRGRARSVDPTYSSTDLRVLSYGQILSKARQELDWLLDQLRQPTRDERGSI